MLLTPSRAEDRVFQFVRGAGELRVTAPEVANRLACDVDDTQHALDELVQRGLLHRFDVPGEGPVYWD
jgi:hypothetical protein